MKPLTVSSASIVAIIISYCANGAFQEKNSIYFGNSPDHFDPGIIRACPVERNVISRDFQSEGVISTIKVQAINPTRFTQNRIIND